MTCPLKTNDMANKSVHAKPLCAMPLPGQSSESRSLGVTGESAILIMFVGLSATRTSIGQLNLGRWA
jgi:hypothetical protein